MEFAEYTRMLSAEQVEVDHAEISCKYYVHVEIDRSDKREKTQK